MSWPSRLLEASVDQFYASVDGTDCLIEKPSPHSSVWYSHKLNTSALQYEIGVSIEKARIVTVNRPCPAGT